MRGRGFKARERTMKYLLAIVAAASICAAVPASAEDVGVGVRANPVGAGVTVGEDHRDRDRERTTVIKEREREPRETTVIKERDRERPQLRKRQWDENFCSAAWCAYSGDHAVVAVLRPLTSRDHPMAREPNTSR